MNYLLVLLISIFSCNIDKAPKHFSEGALNDTFTTLQGESIDFKTILEKHKGKTIVIDIWASWCRDCIIGMPKVKELQSKHKDVVFVFLSLDRGVVAWKRGIEKYKVKGEHYYMPSGKKCPFADFVKIDWIPRYMVINKAGKIELFNAIKADDNKLVKALKK
ncbi:TlpA family protein disulfide reductase [Aestuariivivens insulae]|uniref:TlpA family protein disulfide reductase n=1 Tax=Aestuariivivens insulae TaxID=1621988 RepID=UPI001F59A8AA|nr:TlpA disulfide reductase family protein [Aestuariivivens insulae]